MARKRASLQINSFSNGLITEANPLKEDPKSSYDEVNMELLHDGSRIKRRGFDFEDSYQTIDSDYSIGTNQQLYTSIFKWDNAGGDPDKSLLVVQIGLHLAVYDLDTTPVSSAQIYSVKYDYSDWKDKFDFSVVDGLLVVTTGGVDIFVLEYDGSSITSTTERLKIRDLFGVQAFDGDIELTLASNVDYRPGTLTDEHVYNLRNQTFAAPRFGKNDEVLKDCITRFVTNSTSSTYSTSNSDEITALGLPEGTTSFSQTYGKYPSNSDSVIPYLYANPNDSDNRTIERYFAEDAVNSNLGTSQAPRGRFIIDALARGHSRMGVIRSLQSKHSELNYSVSSLPRDRTPGGPSLTEQFAGRVWFAGFIGDVLNGDANSPRLSSYVMFSQLVRDKTDIGKCYQAADPTSHVDSAIVDTDGGFIRIDGAYEIVALKVYHSSLFVFAKNGVWRISGTSSTPFSATNYEVNRISHYGCEAGSSVVAVDNSIYYWSRESIQQISQDQYGVWNSNNITVDTIKSIYRLIDSNERKNCFGYYNPYDRKIRWIYNTNTVSKSYGEELILDLDFGAFTYNKIAKMTDDFPLVTCISENQPYKENSVVETVTAGGATVTVGGSTLTSEVVYRSGSKNTAIYLVIEGVSPTVTYSFANYTDSDLYDWSSSGTDYTYDAYIIAAFTTGGEPRSRKQIPYLHAYFYRTETGFDGSLNPVGASSCLFSTYWSWTDNIAANKWSSPRQAYRYRRSYTPTGPSDPYETGDTIIYSKNKVRGFGRSFAFKFEAEDGKDLHIYGWAFDLLANSEE